MVALSSCKAEYIDQTQVAKKAIWLQNLLEQLDNLTVKNSSLALISHNKATIYIFNAIIIHCDNQRAITLAENPQFHARTKHINTQ